MSGLLPSLRQDLDIVVSPLPDRPGLLLRDPFNYSQAILVVPPSLAPCLAAFDGAHSVLNLERLLAPLATQEEAPAVAASLVRALSEAGFLENEVFHGLRTASHQRFAHATVRDAAHAGGGYPADVARLAETMNTWMGAPTHSPTGSVSVSALPAASAPNITAVAAPHVSPVGGVATYAAAYGALRHDLGDRTFVVLGTSHYGRPNQFGLTRKPFRTPFGDARTDAALVDELAAAAPSSMHVEDYCHAVEHSIEFQVLFLQSLYGPEVRILPVLCGAFIPESDRAPFSRRGRPEDDERVAAGIEAIRGLQRRHGQRLAWVLGVDMAHIGRRYGDALVARAHEGAMTDLATRDRARLDRIVDGDADGFWELINEKGADDLKWCGSAPLYSFLRACPGARGQVRHYDQWNIDDSSVVSFAALAFTLCA